MKHNYILIFGILFSLIYIHFVKNYKTNETFIDYSEDDKNTIYIIFTNLVKPWKNMYYYYKSKNIVVLNKLIINNNIENNNTLLGFINSSNLINLDNKVFFSKFINKYNKPYYPETYIYENKQFDKELTKKEDLFYVKNTTTQTFGGKGIYIFKKPSNVRKFVELNNTKNFIIQKNIGEPYLYNSRKADFRFYLLAININGNINFYLYNDAFLKMAPNKYIKNNNSISKKVLLTNNTQRTDYVVDNILVSNLEDKKEIFNKSKDLLTDLSKSMKKEILQDLKNKNTFQIHIMGPDIIFDDKLNPYILEINNLNPAFILKKNSSEIKLLKLKVADDIINNFVLPYMKNNLINEKDSNFIKIL